MTGHYRGAHAGAPPSPDSPAIVSIGGMVGGRGGGGRRTAHPRITEELLR